MSSENVAVNNGSAYEPVSQQEEEQVLFFNLVGALHDANVRVHVCALSERQSRRVQRRLFESFSPEFSWK